MKFKMSVKNQIRTFVLSIALCVPAIMLMTDSIALNQIGIVIYTFLAMCVVAVCLYHLCAFIVVIFIYIHTSYDRNEWQPKQKFIEICKRILR